MLVRYCPFKKFLEVGEMSKSSRYPKMAIPDDFDAENDGYTTVIFCIPNSRKWRGLITAHINSLTFGRFWDGNTGIIKEAQAIGREIFASMSICKIDEQLERIATALEDIDRKVVERYTYQEFIDDIEDAFGIMSIPKVVAESVFGLMPRLQAKVDFTTLMRSFLETYMRYKPIHQIGWAVVAALGGIATATMTGNTLALVRTFLDAFNMLNSEWKEVVTNGRNAAWEVLKKVWDLFTPESLAGEAPENVDSSPRYRIAMAINNNNLVNISVSELCCALSNDIISANSILPDGGEEYDPIGAQPVIHPVPGHQYGEAVTDQGKCDVSEWIIQKSIIWLEKWSAKKEEISEAYKIGTPMVLAASQIALYTFGFGLPFSAIIAIAGAIMEIVAAFGTSWANQIEDAILRIDAQRDELRCVLYSSSSPREARANFNSALAGIGLDMLTVAFLNDAIANHVYNALFIENSAIDTSSINADCSECEEPEEIVYHFSDYYGMNFVKMSGHTYEFERVIFPPWNRSAAFIQVLDEQNNTLPFYITDYTVVEGQIPEQWSTDNTNWNSFPIPDNQLFLPYLTLIYDTPGETGYFKMRATFVVVRQ